MKQVVLVQGITNTGQNTTGCYVGIKKAINSAGKQKSDNRSHFWLSDQTRPKHSFLRSISASMEFKPESLNRSELVAKLGTLKCF